MPADPSQVRRIELAGYTGDAWALPATLEAPPPDVPRLTADKGQLAWQVRAMSSGEDDAVQVADAALDVDAVLVVLDGAGEAVARTVVATGVTADQLLVDDDVRPGDRCVLAITAVNATGPAPWIWLVPLRGVAGVEP